jgi:phosphoglycolate phosphatase
VATGKSRIGLERALDTTGLRPRFDATRCGDEGFTKPHPGMLEYLLDHLDVPRDRAVMVGDTTHDIEMANNAGVSSIAVTYGAHEPEKLGTARPNVTVHSPEELWDWLKQNA